MLKFIASLSLLVSVQAFAQTHYDSTSGNLYNHMGNTTFGSNANTGSTWSQTNTATGSYGTDSSGNTWNYNKSTNVYQNSNGVTCTGSGAYRVCN